MTSDKASSTLSQIDRALPNKGVHALVLGTMQDGGLPHIGCRCHRCTEALDDPSFVEYVACLGIIDLRRQPAGVWMIDATPDIKYQMNLLAQYLGAHPDRANRIRPPDGLFLTHAHMGHTAGLPQFGPEAMAEPNIRIYASSTLLRVLEQTKLWQPVISSFDRVSIEPNQPITLAEKLTITAIAVPHRDELGSGTYGYQIDGPAQSLLYIPDIDSWESWSEASHVINRVDIAIVDGSFFSDDELAGRDAVAHPMIPDTVRIFSELNTTPWFTHLNHTNPLLDEGSRAHFRVQLAGGRILKTGHSFEL